MNWIDNLIAVCILSLIYFKNIFSAITLNELNCYVSINSLKIKGHFDELDRDHNYSSSIYIRTIVVVGLYSRHAATRSFGMQHCAMIIITCTCAWQTYKFSWLLNMISPFYFADKKDNKRKLYTFVPLIWTWP